MTYSEDEYLQISGLQHFSFCRRQWALIHIEQQWTENLRTVEGEIFHEHVHNEGFSEKRKDLLTVCSLRVFSPTLGVSGSCDMVEFHASENGVTLAGREGKWLPHPIEYKHGSSKENDADRLQLCCQAMCLEEMLLCDIPYGSLFYQETRRRERIELTSELRNTVNEMLAEMHDDYRRGHTPKAKPQKCCNACSLKEICLPKLSHTWTAVEYLESTLKENPS